jgi:hypothetical protein
MFVLGSGFCLFVSPDPCQQVLKVGAKANSHWKGQAIRPCRPRSPGWARVLA